MKVCVEKSHITNGVAKDSQRCMIADAIKDCCPKAQFIQVDLQTIRFSDPVKRKRFVYLTPPVAQHNLLRFDQGEAVKPFAFTLATPVRSRSMDKREGTPARRASARKASKKYAANKKKYAYLAANRARNHQREREFGIKKFGA
jgi:hypothetical protein